MMRKRFSLFLLAMLFAALACNVPGGGPSVDPNLVKTQVSEKLTAIATSEILPVIPTSGPGLSDPTREPATAEPIPTSSPHLRIVYTSGGNAWIKDEANPPQQLTLAGGVTDVFLSDDGMKVAYIKRDAPSSPPAVGVVNSDGSGDHIALTSVQLNALYPLGDSTYTDIHSAQFLPGTHQLILTTRKAMEGPGLIKYNDALSFDVDSGTLFPLLSPGNGGDIYPSPDGTKFLISRPTAIALANSDGSGLTGALMTFDSVITYSEGQFYPEIVWRPDSALAGVLIPSADPLAPAPSGAVWHINPSTSTASLLASFPGKFAFPLAHLSPDLTHIGYIQIAGADDELYIRDVAGPLSLHLGSGTSAVTEWSKDGQWFAYYLGSPTSRFVGSLAGGTLPLGADVMTIRWITSTKFLYLSGTMASWTLRLGDTSGGSSDIASGGGSIPALDADE